MTQYFFVDESGDAGLAGQIGSSSHFVVVMVQLPERTKVNPLVELRDSLNLSPHFEFKFHQSKPWQKERFFNELLNFPFRIRAAIVDKSQADFHPQEISPRQLIIDLIVGLTMRADELDVSNDILIVDGATPTFCRDLRVSFTEQCRQKKRIRPFKNIVGANSKIEDGLQIADMVAGAIRLHSIGALDGYFHTLLPKIVDLWHFPEK